MSRDTSSAIFLVLDLALDLVFVGEPFQDGSISAVESGVGVSALSADSSSLLDLVSVLHFLGEPSWVAIFLLVGDLGEPCSL